MHAAVMAAHKQAEEKRLRDRKAAASREALFGSAPAVPAAAAPALRPIPPGALTQPEAKLLLPPDSKIVKSRTGQLRWRVSAEYCGERSLNFEPGNPTSDRDVCLLLIKSLWMAYRLAFPKGLSCPWKFD